MHGRGGGFPNRLSLFRGSGHRQQRCARFAAMRAEIGVSLGVLILIGQHHAALAITFESEQHKGLC